MLGMSRPIWLECKPQYKETLKQKKLSDFGHKIKVGVRYYKNVNSLYYEISPWVLNNVGPLVVQAKCI